MAEMSLGATTGVSAGTGGGIVVAKWIVACIVAHQIIAPDETLQIMMYAAIAPAVHALYKACRAAFRSWFKRKTGVDIDNPDATNGNGAVAAPAPLAPQG